ncbi:IS66 family insertion sequence element accessory protein TnpB [Bacillus sp. NPDC077411]|uniref:IS66 family insertion sequence element accessory protein TnpB n=1 Tax=Bacillus sp. NPDC077411 TaxID=3363947 RepID=UPI0037CB1730
MLVWEHNGFWLYSRRLERGMFYWPTGHPQLTESPSNRVHASSYSCLLFFVP